MQKTLASFSVLSLMLLGSCLSQRKNREARPLDAAEPSVKSSDSREKRELSEIRIDEGEDLQDLTKKIGRSISEQGLTQPTQTYFILHSSNDQDLRLHGGLWSAFFERFSKNTEMVNGLPVLSKTQVESLKSSPFDNKKLTGNLVLERPSKTIPASKENTKKVRFAEEPVDLRQRYLNQKSYLEKKLGRSGERYIHINGLTVLRSPKDLKALLRDAKKGDSYIVFLPIRSNNKIPLSNSDLKNVSLEPWGKKGLKIFVDNREPAVAAYPFKLTVGLTNIK